MNDFTGDVIINEIHYDNAGSDVGEFIELKAPLGTDFTGFELALYNGSNGTVYNTEVVDATMNAGAVDEARWMFISRDSYHWDSEWSTDGMALVNPSGTVCEFLSYEGTITATNGPANGTTSTDIGVAETSGTPIGSSLQLFNGAWYLDTETPNAANICFVDGTKISTPQGQVNVEDLKEGDEVICQDGEKKEVVWIGYQQVNIEETNQVSDPVCIKQNALGDNIPSADLYVSPEHAILVEGILINAGAMVNGATITQEKAKANFSYYHVELKDHSLIYAENCLAESYLAQNIKRSIFDNGEEHVNLNTDKTIFWPMNLPRISSFHKVPAYIRRKLDGAMKGLKKVS